MLSIHRRPELGRTLVVARRHSDPSDVIVLLGEMPRRDVDGLSRVLLRAGERVELLATLRAQDRG